MKLCVVMQLYRTIIYRQYFSNMLSKYIMDKQTYAFTDWFSKQNNLLYSQNIIKAGDKSISKRCFSTQQMNNTFNKIPTKTWCLWTREINTANKRTEPGTKMVVMNLKFSPSTLHTHGQFLLNFEKVDLDTYCLFRSAHYLLCYNYEASESTG